MPYTTSTSGIMMTATEGADVLCTVGSMSSLTALGRASLISNIFTSNHAHTAKNNNNPDRRSSLQHIDTMGKQNASFYRQPSLSRVRPASTGEVRRRNFTSSARNQRFMWYSEECINEPHVVSQEKPRKTSDTTKPTVIDSKEPVGARRPHSILKRAASEDPESSSPRHNPRPILTRSISTTTQVRKELKFQDNVDVFLFDKLQKTSIAVRPKMSEKLKDTALCQSRVTECTIHLPCPIHNESEPCNNKPQLASCQEEPPQDSRTSPPAISDNDITPADQQCDCPVTPVHLFKNLKCDVVRDITGKLSWKLFIPIGDEFIRNRTSVKALSGGRKLIVITYGDRKTSQDIAYQHQYIEKLHLPHPVDAYGVRASMDRDGNLKVNAPFLL